jgi:hypothetical protein
MNGIILLVCCVLPPELPHVEDRVDLIEVNNFYGLDGKYVWTQNVFYDWDYDDARYNVVAWRIAKSSDQLPTRNWSHGAYVVTWNDGEVLRSVKAEAFRTTDTQYDPELVEREYLPKEFRRELTLIPPRFKPKLKKSPIAH